MKTTKIWVAVAPYGGAFPDSARHTRGQVIAYLESEFAEARLTWADLRKMGWSVTKAIITAAPEVPE